MWYPEKRQWAVIWLAVLPAMVLWVNASGARQPEERLAVCLVITGALLAWQFQKKR